MDTSVVPRDVASGSSPFLAGQTVGIVESRDDDLRSMVEATNLYSYLLGRSTNSSSPQAECRERIGWAPNASITTPGRGN